VTVSGLLRINTNRPSHAILFITIGNECSSINMIPLPTAFVLPNLISKSGNESAKRLATPKKISADSHYDKPSAIDAVIGADVLLMRDAFPNVHAKRTDCASHDIRLDSNGNTNSYESHSANPNNEFPYNDGI